MPTQSRPRESWENEVTTALLRLLGSEGSTVVWPKDQVRGFHLPSPPDLVPTQSRPPRSWNRVMTSSWGRLVGLAGSWT